MAVRQPLYSKEEFARRGDKIYESQVHRANLFVKTVQIYPNMLAWK
jgi:hypothetical protein